MDTATDDEIISVGALQIRSSDGLVTAAGRPLTLSIREYELLLALARRSGRIIARGEVYREAWGADMRRGDRSVDVYVHKLRDKLDGALPGWRYIHTHLGFGYRLSAEPAPPAPAVESPMRAAADDGPPDRSQQFHSNSTGC
jgi:DNA-binding response OmpR family regulator